MDFASISISNCLFAAVAWLYYMVSNLKGNFNVFPSQATVVQKTEPVIAVLVVIYGTVMLLY